MNTLCIRFRRTLLALLVLLSTAHALSTAAQVSFTQVTDSTEFPPGTTIPFLGFSMPKVHRGWTVFEGRVRGPGGFTNGIYGWRSGALTTLVDAHTPHPEVGNPFSNNFGIGGEDTLAIEDGVMVFAHQQRLNQAGIFQWSNGVISTLVWTNTVFTGVSAYTGGAVVGRSQATNLIATRFGDPRSGLAAVPGDGSAIAHNFSDDLPGLKSGFKSIGFAAFDRGNLVFWAGTAAQSVLYCWTNGTFRTLADTSALPPGWTVPFSQFGRVAIDGGTAVFTATGTDSRAGLFRVNLDGTGLSRLVDTQTLMPEGGPLTALPLNDWSFGVGNGDVVFEAGSPFGDQGIYLWREGAISRIVGNQGETLEGRRVLATDLGMGCLSEGTVAFFARTVGGGASIYLAHLPRSPLDPLAGNFAQTLAAELLAVPWSLRAWLERTEEGRRLIRLYDQHAAELLRLALANGALREQTLTTLNEFLPGLSSFLAGDGGANTISSNQVARLNDTWDGYLAGASPGLASALAAERARFNGFDDFAGRSFAEWGVLLAIGVPDAPFVILSRPQRIEGTFRAEANPVPGAAYHLERATGELPVQWMEVPGAEIRPLENRVEVLDADAASEIFLYRLRLQP